jgi:hypothetical protein
MFPLTLKNAITSSKTQGENYARYATSVNITPWYVKIKTPLASLASKIKNKKKIKKKTKNNICIFSLGILVPDDGAMRGELKYEA